MSYLIDDAGEILDYVASEGLSAGTRIGAGSAEDVDLGDEGKKDQYRELIAFYQEDGTPDPARYGMVALTDAIAPEIGGAFIANFNQGFLVGYLERLEQRVFDLE